MISALGDVVWARVCWEGQLAHKAGSQPWKPLERWHGPRAQGLRDDGQPHDRRAGYRRGQATAERGCVHWSISLQPPKASIMGLNSEG